MLGKDATVLWRRLERLEEKVLALENLITLLEGRSRVRLKEEADMRERTFP